MKKPTPSAAGGSLNDEVSRLVEQIREHNRRYWVEHKPSISDIEYDRLVERLRALDPENPVLDEIPDEVDTAATGEEQRKAKRQKVRHAAPMLSIEKCFAVEDVVKWATNAGAWEGDAAGIVSSYKVDGSSCSLLYENGKLIRAATRGTGSEGDEITPNVKTIADVPQTIASKDRLEVRGEIYMTIASFKKAVELFEKRVASGDAHEDERPVNPRNYCAGSIKLDDPEATRARGLSFMAHGVIGKIAGGDGKSEAANQKALAKLGFGTPFFRHVTSAAEVGDVTQEIESQRTKLPYEIDGVVFTINRLALHQELGATSHHPRYKLAFKFSREQGETKVVRLIWHTTRSGRVSPAMEVAPIMLGGATVTLCTLHNAKLVKEKALRVGDKVLLEREVIPYFVDKTSDSGKPAELPDKCLSCNAELVWDETETNLACPNLGGCSSQLHDFLSYYVSRGVTNMMGLGEKLISKLMEKGLLKSPVDFYTLTEKKILDNIERTGETSARNTIAAIQGRREQTLETFLVSLGIRGLGPSVAARLVNHFHTLEAIRKATPEEMLNVEGVAETMSEVLTRGLKERSKLIDALLEHVTLKLAEKREGVLSGKSFCLTGHVEFDHGGKHYDARPDIEDLIKSQGGTIKSVSKTLDYLIVGSDAGSKVEKAKKANVKILDAAELLKMLKMLK